MSVKENLRQDLRHAVDEFIDNATPNELNNINVVDFKSTLEKVVSRRSMYKERFGYFYSSSSAAEKLNQSRQALNKAVQARRVLRVKTRDGEYVYPSFQFAGSKVVPEISRLVSILKDGGMDDWSVLYWLTNPLPMFDGETPASMAMNNDGRFEQVVELAQADAVHWVAAG